jgi:hypothetical protein
MEERPTKNVSKNITNRTCWPQNNMPDRQCTYNIIMRRFRLSIVAAQRNNNKYEILHCVSAFFSWLSRMQNAYFLHRMFIVIRSLSSSNIFFHIISGTIYGKDVLRVKRVHWLTLQLLPETSHSKKNLTKYYRKCTMYSHVVLFIILVVSQSCIFSIYFRKILRNQISCKSVQLEPSPSILTGRWTDGRTLMKNLIVFFSCCLSVHVDNYTIITPTKCTSFLLLKAQDITICTFLSLYF